MQATAWNQRFFPATPLPPALVLSGFQRLWGGGGAQRGMTTLTSGKAEIGEVEGGRVGHLSKEQNKLTTTQKNVLSSTLLCKKTLEAGGGGGRVEHPPKVQACSLGLSHRPRPVSRGYITAPCIPLALRFGDQPWEANLG